MYSDNRSVLLFREKDALYKEHKIEQISLIPDVMLFYSHFSQISLR